MMKNVLKLLATVALFVCGNARAVNLIWDADPATTSAQDGIGAWYSSDTNWWDGAANVSWVNGTNVAVFGATNGAADIIVLGEPITAGGISFTNPGSGSYSIDNSSTLTLIGAGPAQFPAITVASGVTASIAANITSTASNGYKKGLGTLNLSGTIITTNREFHLDGGVVNFSGASWNATKFLVGSTYAGPATVLNWNSGSGSVTNNYLGISDNGSGTMNMNGGSFVANNGANGMFIGNNVNCTGVLNVAGGTFTCVAGSMWIGASFNGLQNFQPTWGYLNITNGTFNFTGSKIQLTGGSNLFSSVAAINLDGGTFNLNGAPITNGVGTNTFNFNGGVLRFTANNGNVLTVQRANVRNGGAIISFSSNYSATVAQALEHSNIGGDNAVDGGLTKRDANSTLTLAGNNTYNGGTRINAGVLQMGGGGNSGTVGSGDVTISNNAQFVFRRADTVVFSNKVTGIGSGGVLMQATGTVTITGTNNSWGLTYPQMGTLEFDLGDGIFTGAGKFSMNGNVNATLNWKSGTGNLPTADFITFADNVAGTSTVNITGGTLNFHNTGNRVLVGNQNVAIINVSGGALNIGNGGSSKVPLIIGGDIQWDLSNAKGFLNISGTGSVVVAGGSTFTLGVNTNAGVKTNATGMINLDGGVLQTARDIARGNGNAWFNFNGGILKSGAASTNFMGGLTRANIRNGGAIIDTSLGSIVIVQPLEHSDIGGDNATDGGLVKTGTNVLTLAATNSFTGPAIVSNGTLIVNGLAGGGAVTVDAGATLGGTGSIMGSVVSSGKVAPGSSAGRIAFEADYTQTSGASLDIDIGGPGIVGVNYDQIEVVGTANIDGELNVSLINGYTGAAGDSFTVVNAADLSGTFATTNLPALSAGLGWSVTYPGTFVVLSVTGAPPVSGYDAFALAITNAAQRGYQDDPDADGYANLLEYVTGGNPASGDTIARMNGAQTNGLLALIFSRATNAVDATLVVEGAYSSTNDAPWTGIATNIAGSWGASPGVNETTGGSPVTVTVQDSAATATNRFLRLRVSRP